MFTLYHTYDTVKDQRAYIQLSIIRDQFFKEKNEKISMNDLHYISLVKMVVKI